MDELKQKRLFLLDLDGTIYLDDQLFDGTLDFLQYVRDIGGTYRFLTNNSSRGTESYLQKLHGMGIEATKEQFITSVDATVRHLRQKKYKSIYVFGTGSFQSQLEQAGLPVTTVPSPQVACLCMGFDTELTFQKLEDACILLGQGVDYVATNPDWVCPTRYGFVPDCGSVAEMLFHATKRRPLVIGKPEPAMLELAMEQTGYSRAQTIILGDRLYTDIASGKRAGVATALMLSGEATLADLSQSAVQPDYIFANIREMLTRLTRQD